MFVGVDLGIAALRNTFSRPHPEQLFAIEHNPYVWWRAEERGMDDRADQMRVEAARCRAAAEKTKDNDLRKGMIEVAQKYENLANGIDADVKKRRQRVHV